MKVGIIGFGSIGQRHYNNLKRYTKDIIVLSRRTDINGKQFVNTWGVFKKRGFFEIIFITNETYKHLTTIRKCIDLKPKAIFVEKPLAPNSQGLEALAKILKQEKISLFVGYNFQFYKPFLEIRKILKSRQLGKIYFVRAAAGRDLRQWRQRDYRKIYSADKRKGGGVMLDFVHDINYPAWLLGKELIPQTAVIRKISGLQINSEDIAESIFTTADNIIVAVHQDYLRVPGERSLEIIGQKGTLVWHYSGQVITVYSETSRQEKRVDGDYNKTYLSELQYFLRQFKSGKFFSNIEEAIRDVKNIEYLKRHASW